MGGASEKTKRGRRVSAAATVALAAAATAPVVRVVIFTTRAQMAKKKTLFVFSASFCYFGLDFATKNSQFLQTTIHNAANEGQGKYCLAVGSDGGFVKEKRRRQRLAAAAAASVSSSSSSSAGGKDILVPRQRANGKQKQSCQVWQVVWQV